MRTAYKCRLYPDPDQQAMLSRTFGCVRLVWNKALAERNRTWEAEGKQTTYGEASAALTRWKRTQDFAFLKEVPSVPLQQALRHQQAAFANFFSGRAERPRFKSRSGRQTAHFARSAFRLNNGELGLARIVSPLKFVWSFEGVDLASLEPSMVVVSRDPDGRWFVTFAADTADPDPEPAIGRSVGIDLGVKDFAVTSDGQRITGPRHLDRKARNLARYQRRMARCQKGSANRIKAKAKVARAHRKIRNARADFLHKTSTRIVRDNDLIAIEDLAVANMVKNRRLAKRISDAAWGEFRRMIEYKAERAGRTLAVVDRWYPSSKTCSHCGHLLDRLDLSTRAWRCPTCRTWHDRDINAAKNILAAGRVAAGQPPGEACGADVRRQGSSLPQSAMKQEPPRARAQGVPAH
ncbi:RNA-guided endonuclease InsQ/TnpB family protein [Glycomyces albidus]|uniref:IS200/IS605 family element transposase accessory protein TnpB n=1 Tax=Glycomyces albidus TaxID=2656774 RepID=A0A6L5G421_9ACTN|nr:RNA-guided endonuclease TnpB family protein [Glycomyces albidus]MQM24382.1 IS200/IS605 family element transposase accessory protein TnpB [Glycomyces albidus]